MRTRRNTTVVLLALALAGSAWRQNGQVRFRGMVTTAEAHLVTPGYYYVTVSAGTVLADPNSVLRSLKSVQVCYATALNLKTGAAVEVNGYYWAVNCPTPYCNRVQIRTDSDYIAAAAGAADEDWMVVGDLMYSIPWGNVGIGVAQPREKLHVAGNLLLENTVPVWLKFVSGLGQDVGISLTTTGTGVNTWQILREGRSADLFVKETFPYPPFSNDALVVKTRTGNIGIGTSDPNERLHVVGTALLESPAGAGALDEPLRVVKGGSGRQLLAYFVNPTDGAAETEVQLAGGKLLPWGWSLKGANGLFTLSNIAVAPPALNVASSGQIGLGVTAPAYRLDLPNTANEMGQARANAWKTYSSARWKTNVRPIDHALAKVEQLRGVYFDWRDEGKHDLGLIAEEVGRIVPEIVDYEANGTDARSLAYDRLVALLIEALKEQQTQITQLQQAAARSKDIEQRLSALERLVQQPNSLTSITSTARDK